MKTVKAWATYSEDGKARVYETHLYTRKGVEFLAGFAKVEPVRIVPESEYRRMMAAVKFIEAFRRGETDDWDRVDKLLDGYRKHLGITKAKGKVKRGK
jgi:hypothetical protein